MDTLVRVGNLTLVIHPTERLLQDIDRMQSRAVELLSEHVNGREDRQRIVLNEQQQWAGPGFESIDTAILARFGGAKVDRITWKQFGSHIEFWSAVYCLRLILSIRTEGRKTEAELWRSAYELGRIYANMQTAKAWAAGGMSSKKGRPKGITRTLISDDEIESALRTTKRNAVKAGQKLGMHARSVRRRVKKMRTAKP